MDKLIRDICDGWLGIWTFLYFSLQIVWCWLRAQKICNQWWILWWNEEYELKLIQHIKNKIVSLSHLPISLLGEMPIQSPVILEWTLPKSSGLYPVEILKNYLVFLCRNYFKNTSVSGSKLKSMLVFQEKETYTHKLSLHVFVYIIIY